uniref:Uncharacterized protein n=1 Tax=Cyanistes caeruleus TaxID=156563 RepID=A0A8C0VVZ2_CYACU
VFHPTCYLLCIYWKKNKNRAGPSILFGKQHSSYGRLLDDHDYGSWGNYNNPLYDDS